MKTCINGREVHKIKLKKISKKARKELTERLLLAYQVRINESLIQILDEPDDAEIARDNILWGT